LSVALPLPDPPLADDVVQLRSWTPSDAGSLARAWHDPEIARWGTTPADASEEAALHWIGTEAERRTRGLALDLAVELIEERKVVGEVGLARLDVPRGLAETGWWIDAEHRGRGLASRAVSLLAGWALTELCVDQLYARLDPANEPSIGVARAAGFDRRGTARDGLEVWSRRA
jgi:ribosomal-protein-alanine N-acetyltransferase